MMGEIKSTLEIIMEKAKGLSITEEEKKAIQKKELNNRIKILINRYIEGGWNIEKLKEELKSIDDKDIVDSLIIRQCMEKLELGSENISLLDLIQEFDPKLARSVRRIISEYVDKMEGRKQIREEMIRNSLNREGISGSAIVININADNQWQSILTKLKEEFKDEIDKCMQR